MVTNPNPTQRHFDTNTFQLADIWGGQTKMPIKSRNQKMLEQARAVYGISTPEFTLTPSEKAKQRSEEEDARFEQEYLEILETRVAAKRTLVLPVDLHERLKVFAASKGDDAFTFREAGMELIVQGLDRIEATLTEATHAKDSIGNNPG
jgi:hypothetical protein